VHSSSLAIIPTIHHPQQFAYLVDLGQAPTCPAFLSLANYSLTVCPAACILCLRCGGCWCEWVVGGGWVGGRTEFYRCLRRFLAELSRAPQSCRSASESFMLVIRFGRGRDPKLSYALSATCACKGQPQKDWCVWSRRGEVFCVPVWQGNTTIKLLSRSLFGSDGRVMCVCLERLLAPHQYTQTGEAIDNYKHGMPAAARKRRCWCCCRS